MSDSIELATIYLVDLVGSTRLATSVGPARADELRNDYFALLREAIGASGGKAFKDTGDGLFAAFSSASAGVGAAVLTQQLFERRYRGAEQQLHVRIGLATGESTVRDGNYFGMPSIEAARLCDKAPTDGILASLGTKLMAGRVEGAKFESAGELELKGLPEPVQAFAVLWEPLEPESGAAVGGWPLPSALRSLPRISFVGRYPERALVDASRVATRAGERRVVLLAGEPGIGKTRLAFYQALAAHAEGFGVCWGACSEDLAAPYEPWIEVCSQLVEHGPQDALAAHVERSGGELSRLARNLPRRVRDTPAPQGSDPETERFLLFQAVAEALRAVSASVPVCVVLDDFQWADGQSVALLKHVSRTVEEGALQVIVTYRDSDLGKDHPLSAVLQDLRRVEGVDRIALQGLEVEDVAEMTRLLAGHDLDADGMALVGEIATETGGNPFFVGEILRNLRETGLVVFDEASGRWNVDRSSGVGLPQSVRDVVERRVDILGAAGREVLRVASVIGRVFDVDLLARLVEIGEGELLDHLEAAVIASLLSESTEKVGRFAFEHALINRTLYDNLGATRRARMHQRVAETLEELYGSGSRDRLAELALHWRLATVSVDARKAAHYSMLAGRQALESLAPSEAARLFADALELIGTADTAERCEALIGLGEAQRLTGQPASRETLLDAARIASALCSADLAGRAALANNRGAASAVGRVDSERIAAIERAVELDEPPTRLRRARLLALEAQELSYDSGVERRRELAQQAIGLAREAGDPRTLAGVLRDALYGQFGPDTVELRAANARELLACAEATQDPAFEFFGLYHLLSAQIESAELENAEGVLRQMQRLADERALPTVRWIAAFFAGAWALLRGDLDAAEQLAGRALQIGEDAGEPDARLLYGACLLAIRVCQGRGEEITEMRERAAAATGMPVFRAGLASHYCWIGRREDAAAIVHEAARDGFAHVPWDLARTTALAHYADAAAQIGDVDPCATLYELLEPWSGQMVWNGASAYGHTRIYLGMLADVAGRHALADQHLAFAIEFHNRYGLRVWAARAHLAWAETLAARGDADRAREQATLALRLSREHGYGAFAPRAASILEAGNAAEV